MMKKLCTELSKQSTLTLIILPDCMSFQEWDFLCNPFTGSETGQPPHQPNWTPEDRRLWPGQSVFWGERPTLQPPGGYKVSLPLTLALFSPLATQNTAKGEKDGWGPGISKNKPLLNLITLPLFRNSEAIWESRSACSTGRRCTLYPSTWLVERIILWLDSYGFVISETRIGYKGQAGDCFWKVLETVCGRLLSEVLC